MGLGLGLGLGLGPPGPEWVDRASARQLSSVALRAAAGAR